MKVTVQERATQIRRDMSHGENDNMGRQEVQNLGSGTGGNDMIPIPVTDIIILNMTNPPLDTDRALTIRQATTGIVVESRAIQTSDTRDGNMNLTATVRRGIKKGPRIRGTITSPGAGGLDPGQGPGPPLQARPPTP